MATIVRQHRGTTAQHATYVGPEGSITVDIDKDVVVVHDGVTAGGHPLASDKNVVHTTGNETVNGTKTFSSSPQVPSVDAFDASTNAASTEQVDDALQTMVARVDTLPTDPAALAALKAKLRNNAVVWELADSSSAKAYIYDDSTDSLDELKVGGGGSSITLNNTVTSTSTTEAATANAVKTAYDAATAAQSTANSALAKANAAGTVKSVNGNTPDANGNVTVSTGSSITLNNTVTSTSTTQAATANAVKTAYDAAVSAQAAADAASDGLADKLDKTGTAAAATKLATSRTISLSGDASGSASFNGTANASITTTLANSGVTAGSYGPSANASPAHKGTFTVPQVTVDAKGRVTSAVNRTITLPSDNAGSSVSPSTTTPKAPGTATAGTATTYARGDHVHPLQTTVSGNAGTATKLATARTIRTNLASTTAASFNGSANITPGVTGILPVANGGTGLSSKVVETLGSGGVVLRDAGGTASSQITAGTVNIPSGSKYATYTLTDAFYSASTFAPIACTNDGDAGYMTSTRTLSRSSVRVASVTDPDVVPNWARNVWIVCVGTKSN